MSDDVFVCLDCETTGLNKEQDHIIEIALIKFTFKETLLEKQTLVNPMCLIPAQSIEIHHITQDMIKDQPLIQDILTDYLKPLENAILVGHKIDFDIDMVAKSAKTHLIPSTIHQHPSIDTLRLARLYGESDTNSLEALQDHFRIPKRTLHRAMEDVKLNIDVFKKLCDRLGFKDAKSIIKRLEKPIMLKKMPLGKHKGRPFQDIPLNYLKWASFQEFDNDLLFSIRSEIKRRKVNPSFQEVANPFQDL